MARVVASLAAVACLVALVACGGDGAEPGASDEATLMLDFQPNAVHAGIYAALARGYFEDEGVDLDVREPSASTDAPKLLEAGQVDFAVMDINDVGIAREHGLDVVPVAPIVRLPLASVITTDAGVRRPRDLEDKTVGVTGLPSDDAVLDSVLEADGADPQAVNRVTIGFEAVATLAAGKVDAATAFWNAEGVTLDEKGLDPRVFRVDDYGAHSYPELLLVMRGDADRTQQRLAAELQRGLQQGNRLVRDDPAAALDAMQDEVDGLDEASTRLQLDGLLGAGAFPSPEVPGIEPGSLLNWAKWALEYGVIADPATAREMTRGA